MVEGAIAHYQAAGQRNFLDIAIRYAYCVYNEIGEGEGEFKGEVEGLSVTVVKAEGGKCERCWTYSDFVGTGHPELCERCAKVIG